MIEMFKEELKRIEKIVAMNNKILRSVKGILRMAGKQIGNNATNIKKIMEGIANTGKQFQSFKDEFKGRELSKEEEKELKSFYI